MNIGTLLILIAIGILAGMLGGFVGVGGGLIVVPALMYFLGVNQIDAQGTSLAMMLPPIGILAVWNYHKSGNVNFTYAMIIAISFIVGGYFGSKIALKIPVNKVKLIFGLLMLYTSIRMIYSGMKG